MAALDSQLDEYRSQGYEFITESDKLYIVVEDPEVGKRIVGILDNNSSIDTISAAITSSTEHNPNFVYDSYNHEALGKFVNDFEQATGQKVESAVFNTDGYELVIDGKKVKVPYNKDGTVDLSIAKTRATGKINVNEPLNEENKVAIENYLNESLPENCEATIVLNKTGHYEVQINGETFAVLDKNVTLNEAITEVNNKLDIGKSIGGKTTNLATTNLRKESGDTYKVHINKNEFEEVQGFHTTALNSMNAAKGCYEYEFTDKLLRFYELIADANADPLKRIDKSVELLGNITTNVKYSLEAYDNIDKDLGIILNSVISEIFSMNSYVDEETKELYEKPLEEREQYLQDLIDTYQEELDKLNEEFKEKFGNGISFSEKDFIEIFKPLLHITDVFDNCGLEEALFAPDGGSNIVIDPVHLDKILNYVKENQVIERIEKYFSGGTFKDTIGPLYIEWDTSKLEDYEFYYYEQDFLNKTISYFLDSDRFRSNTLDLNKYQELNGMYSFSYYDPWYFGNHKEYTKWVDVPNDLGNKYYLRDLLIEKGFAGYYQDNSYNNYGVHFKFNDIPIYSSLTDQMEDYYRLKNDINQLSTTIYNYKQYQKIMPYEADMQRNTEDSNKKTYLDYLVQDYSKITGDERLKYLDQRELALYSLYLTDNPTKANNYLIAMSDMINQRKGYEAAANQIMNYPGGIEGFLASGWDGFFDGIGNFFDNIGNIFSPRYERTSEDYKDMFIISLLGEENVYNTHLTDINRFLLSVNYQAMSSFGEQSIPMVAQFIPGVGQYVSTGLKFANDLGRNIKQLTLNGSSAGQAYLCATLQTVSSTVLENCMAGVANKLGNMDGLSFIQKKVAGLAPQAAQGAMSSFLEGGIRSVVLGEPFNMSSSMDAGLEGMMAQAFASMLLKGTSSILVKVANGLTIKISKNEFNSYDEFSKCVRKKMLDSPLGQKVEALKSIGGKVWEQYQANHPDSYLVKMVDSYQYKTSSDKLICIDRETALEMGISLKDGESLVYNPNMKNYQKIDSKGNNYIIPASDINDFEGSMYIKLTEEEQISLRLKQSGEGKLVGKDEDGYYIIETEYGEQLKFTKEEISSGWAGYVIDDKQREHVAQRGELKSIKYNEKSKSYEFTYDNGTTESVPFNKLSNEQKQAIFDDKYKSSYDRAQVVYGDNEYSKSMTQLQADAVELAKTLPYYSSDMDAHLQSYVLTQYSCEIDNVVYNQAKSNYANAGGEFAGVNKYHLDSDGSIVVDEIRVKQADGSTVTVPYTLVIDGEVVRSKASSKVSDNLVQVLSQNEQMIDNYGMDASFLMSALDVGLDTNDIVQNMPNQLKTDWQGSLNTHYDLATGEVDPNGDNVVVFQAQWALDKYSEKDASDNPAKVGYPTGQWMFSVDSLKQALDASGKDVTTMSDVELSNFICELIAVPSGSYGTDVVMVTGNVVITTDNVSNNLAMGANSQYAAGGATASGGFEALSDGKMDISHVYDLNGIRQVLINLGNKGGSV